MFDGNCKAQRKIPACRLVSASTVAGCHKLIPWHIDDSGTSASCKLFWLRTVRAREGTTHQNDRDSVGSSMAWLKESIWSGSGRLIIWVS